MERLFFSRPIQLEVPSGGQLTIQDHLEKNNCAQTIASKTSEEQRSQRKKMDLRQTLSDEQTEKEDTAAEQPCLHHVGGYCNHKPCLFSHQMRLPRAMSVCKFWLSNACTNQMCTFMHGEFPCKYFYCQLPHPGVETNCRFHHGGALSPGVKKALIQSVWFSLGKQHANDRATFEKEFDEMCRKLDAKHSALEEEERGTALPEDPCSSQESVCYLDTLLTNRQCCALAERGLTSVEQLERLSTKQLEEYGLNVDQIYEIKIGSAHSKRKRSASGGEAVVNRTENLPKPAEEETPSKDGPARESSRSTSLFYTETLPNAIEEARNTNRTASDEDSADLIIDEKI